LVERLAAIVLIKQEFHPRRIKEAPSPGGIGK
jgi:hypothetical protein